ncbi:hypothetical protein RJ640_029864 [Escallonia rubra]|uniref:Uncharacterized protein n=1 Tax=Escallonia rubra TaxID=112253 RepID=A0AA88QZC9_9ASTE|nr:hypothetical protein RJ640_029864 [Escallonia rubra]
MADFVEQQQQKRADVVCNFFTKPSKKNRNLRTRSFGADSDIEDGDSKVEISYIVPKRKQRSTPQNKLNFFSTASNEPRLLLVSSEEIQAQNEALDDSNNILIEDKALDDGNTIFFEDNQYRAGSWPEQRAADEIDGVVPRSFDYVNMWSFIPKTDRDFYK